MSLGRAPWRLLRSILVACAIGLTTLPAYPNPGKDPGKVEVTLVLLDTVVTDRKGLPIRGLTAADFDLLIDNALSPIEAVEERCGGGPHASTTPSPDGTGAPEESRNERDLRHLVLFFDFAHMKVPARNASLKSALQYVDQMMTPSDRVMLLAAAKGALRIVSPFTDDRALLDERLRWMKDEASLVDTVAFEEENTLERLNRTGQRRLNADLLKRMSFGDGMASIVTPGECLGESRIAETDAMRAIRAMANTMPAFGGVPGRKALILFSETLRARASAAYHAACGVSMNESHELGLTVLPELADLVEKANLAGVSFYPVHAGGLSAGATELVMDDVVGFQQSVALSTGGKAFIMMNDPVRVFEQAASDLGCNYVLFYRPPEGFRSGRHAVTVRVHRKGVQVRHRESFSLLTNAEVSDEQMLSALSAPGLYRDLPIDGHGFSLSEPRRGRRSFLVQASIPVSALSLIPSSAESSTGNVQLRGGVISSDGKLECEFKETIGLDVPRVDEKAPRRAGIQALCSLTEGEHEIVIAGRDENGGALGTFWGKVRTRPAASSPSGSFLWTRPSRETWVLHGEAAGLPAIVATPGDSLEQPTILQRTAILGPGEPAAVTYLACPPDAAEPVPAPSGFILLAGPQHAQLPARALAAAERGSCVLLEAQIPAGALTPGAYTVTPELAAPWLLASGPLSLKVE